MTSPQSSKGNKKQSSPFPDSNQYMHNNNIYAPKNPSAMSTTPQRHNMRYSNWRSDNPQQSMQYYNFSSNRSQPPQQPNNSYIINGNIMDRYAPNPNINPYQQYNQYNSINTTSFNSKKNFNINTNINNRTPVNTEQRVPNPQVNYWQYENMNKQCINSWQSNLSYSNMVSNYNNNNFTNYQDNINMNMNMNNSNINTNRYQPRYSHNSNNFNNKTNNNYYTNNQPQLHHSHRDNPTPYRPNQNQFKQSNRNYEIQHNKYQDKNKNTFNINSSMNMNKNQRIGKQVVKKQQIQGKKQVMINQQYSSEGQDEQEEDQEQIYQKTKQIIKKRDPILDSPQEIKKWIEARKRNYPKCNPNICGQEDKKLSGQMSLLQSKIRKKIIIISGDSRGAIKKLKNMHILKRIVGDLGKNTPINKKKNDKLKQRTKFTKYNESRTKIYNKNKMELEGPIIKQDIQIQKIQENIQQNSDQPQEIPICKAPPICPVNQVPAQILKPSNIKQKDENQESKVKMGGFTPQQMIKHLKQKQQQDKQFYGNLLNYKTNSLNYKYSVGTLQTNFVLEDIFEQSSYLLQIIRYIIKNDYFDKRQ